MASASCNELVRATVMMQCGSGASLWAWMGARHILKTQTEQPIHLIWGPFFMFGRTRLLLIP